MGSKLDLFGAMAREQEPQSVLVHVFDPEILTIVFEIVRFAMRAARTCSVALTLVGLWSKRSEAFIEYSTSSPGELGTPSCYLGFALPLMK